MKSIIQKGIIPARTQEIFKPVDHVKYDGQVTSHAKFMVCAVFSLSFQTVVLLTETVISHRFVF